MKGKMKMLWWAKLLVLLVVLSMNMVWLGEALAAETPMAGEGRNDESPDGVESRIYQIGKTVVDEKGQPLNLNPDHPIVLLGYDEFSREPTLVQTMRLVKKGESYYRFGHWGLAQIICQTFQPPNETKYLDQYEYDLYDAQGQQLLTGQTMYNSSLAQEEWEWIKEQETFCTSYGGLINTLSLIYSTSCLSLKSNRGR